MLKLSREARAAKFKAIGKAISASPSWHDRVDDSDKDQAFELKRYDTQNRDPEDPLNTDKRARTEVPLGPRFKTPQWERTNRRP